MTKDISVANLIRCAEIHDDDNAECSGCDYKDYGDCVDVMLADAITIIKAGYDAACKPENRPIDKGKDEGSESISTEYKYSHRPIVEAYEVNWYDCGDLHCPQFTDIENAIKFADAVMRNKPEVDMVTIRRSKW